MLYHCETCNQDTTIVLAPDFSSSGLWCDRCGINYANLEEDFLNLPKGLIALIYMWVNRWDREMSGITKSTNIDIFKEDFIWAGHYLRDEIRKYYWCEFTDGDVFYYLYDKTP